MVKQYIQQCGRDGLFKYRPSDLTKAIEEARLKRLSINQIAKKWQVPRTTLQSKVKGKYSLKHGRPRALPDVVEKQLEECLLICAEWDMPLKMPEVRDVVKNYLTKVGKVVKSFKNNTPGIDWVRSFLMRRPLLTVRLASNVKRQRIAVTEEVLNLYFDNLEKALEDIPPEATVYYDETNFTDDPLAGVVICKRGSRHVQQIMDTSKTSTSVMASIAGNGELLPFFTVYKAVYVYPTWIEGGRPGDRYASNESGWFDMRLFEEWFSTVALPYLKQFNCKKALLGDNLCSHLSINVIKLCQDNNIKFVLLPPNSTHLTQPLDVACWMFRLAIFLRKFMRYCNCQQ